MTRIKKSRKPAPLAPSFKPKEMLERAPAEHRVHPGKGRKPGSRFNVAKPKRPASAQQGAAQDPRKGSKKPITLLSPAGAPPAFDRAKAEAELLALQQDSKLQDLLERLEQDQALSPAELKYLDQRTERFEQLAELLGLEVDEDDDD